MIRRKIIELENIGFVRDDEHERLDAIVSIDTDDPEPEMLIEIDTVQVSIPVEDIIGSLQELGIDLEAWVPKGDRP